VAAGVSCQEKNDASDVSGKLFYRRVHRFLLSGMDSEFASDVGKSDRFFDSSSLYFLGLVLAPRLFTQWLAQNFSQQSASHLAGKLSNGSYWSGGFPMQLTKALERLLGDFLQFKQTNVDDGSQMPETYNSPEEMEQAFEEWVGELVHSFVSELDWEEIFKERGEGYDA
jgi:hypothetical protein